LVAKLVKERLLCKFALAIIIIFAVMERKYSTALSVLILGMALYSCASSEEADIITSIDDLDGKTVSTLSGSVQDLLLTDKCPTSEILRSDSDTDVYMMVETGKAVATVTSEISWRMAKAGFKNLIQVGEGINPQPIGYIARKGNGDLLERFNAFLTDYISNNDMQAIIDEWSDIDGGRRMPDPSEVSGESGTIRFAVSAIIPPYNFIRNGKVCGAEAEILALFAKSENMKWEFIDVNFSGLITCVQSGKADMGASIMCITPERQQSVDFSIPWSVEQSILLVNSKYVPEELLSENDSEQSFWESTKESFEKSLIREERWKMLLKGLGSTLLISLLAAIFGTLLGILLCYTSMHRSKLLSKASNVYIEFMRCMPQVVFLMIMFYVVFAKSELSGIWVAIIAFALCFASYTSVIFRSTVQSIDKGQSEAAWSMGFGKVKAFWHVILPQVIQRALPIYKGEVIGLVKATSIVGYIAVFDLTKAGDIIRSRTYEAFFPLILVTIIYFLVIWILSSLLKGIESTTQPKRKKFFK